MENSIVALSGLLDMTNPEAVLNEVESIVRTVCPDFNVEPLEAVYNDIAGLFKGNYPGYQGCNTRYHDLQHTTDCMLALARLMHGAVQCGERFTQEEFLFGLVCALMHDAGYIQDTDDDEGTGAKYTLVHVQRSIEFMAQYCTEHSILTDYIKDEEDILNCTGVNTQINTIDFSNRKMELLGKILGTSDLIGQMADRSYLEKLVFLYHEFREAQMDGYDSEYDFLYKTIEFYDVTNQRLSLDLGNVTRFLQPHFRVYYGQDANFYEKAMAKNIDYLSYILTHHKDDYRTMLKRAGLPHFFKRFLTKNASTVLKK